MVHVESYTHQHAGGRHCDARASRGTHRQQRLTNIADFLLRGGKTHKCRRVSVIYAVSTCTHPLQWLTKRRKSTINRENFVQIQVRKSCIIDCCNQEWAGREEVSQKGTEKEAYCAR